MNGGRVGKGEGAWDSEIDLGERGVCRVRGLDFGVFCFSIFVMGSDPIDFVWGMRNSIIRKGGSGIH